MKHSVHIVDGNALLQSLTDLPDTFGDLELSDASSEIMSSEDEQSDDDF